jgi:hypothetical protein
MLCRRSRPECTACEPPPPPPSCNVVHSDQARPLSKHMARQTDAACRATAHRPLLPSPSRAAFANHQTHRTHRTPPLPVQHHDTKRAARAIGVRKPRNSASYTGAHPTARLGVCIACWKRDRPTARQTMVCGCSQPDCTHPSQARNSLLTCSGPLPIDTAAVTCTNCPCRHHL